MKKEAGVDEDILNYENMEKQLEVVLIQKHQLQMQLNEIRHATDELKRAKGEVYRAVGSIMLLSSKDEAEKELKDRQELVEVKLGAIGKQEEKLRESVGAAQKVLQERMKEYASKPPEGQ
jgi:prefoldin beta subunit